MIKEIIDKLVALLAVSALLASSNKSRMASRLLERKFNLGTSRILVIKGTSPYWNTNK